MSKIVFRTSLTAIIAGVAALSAPLAVNAQQQRPQQQPQQQQQQHQPQHQAQQPQPSRPQQQPQAQPQRPQANAQTGRYRITSTVNVRSGPGTNTRRVGSLSGGRVVEVDQVRNGWLHVRGQGWISAQFARRA